MVVLQEGILVVVILVVAAVLVLVHVNHLNLELHTSWPPTLQQEHFYDMLCCAHERRESPFPRK